MKAKTEVNSNGYVVFSDSKKFVHKWRAEKKYGKETIVGKEVHHIDGDKKNNNDNNLILLTKEDHYNLSLHENRIKLLTDLIITGCLTYFFIIIFLAFIKSLNREVFLAMARIVIYFIFIIALELKFGFIEKWIRKPKGTYESSKGTK